MANVQGNGMSRFVLQIAMVVIGAAVVWGAVHAQVKGNTEDIKNKVDKEVFEMHAAEQRRSFEKIDKTMDRMETKLDKALEK